MTQEASPIAKPRRQRNWDALAAVIASFIGLLALCVSAYTAYVQRQQASAQVWTRLFFASSDPDRALLVLNKGVGPARLQSLRLYVDGKAQPDWQRVFEALGMPQRDGRMQSTLNGSVLAANERLEFMKFDSAEDWAAMRGASARMNLRACYCSVLDECQVFDERAPRGARLSATAQCERSADEEFND